MIPIVTSARDLDLVQTASDGIATVTGQVYNAASDLPGQPVEFHVSGPAVNFSNGSNAGIDAGSAKFIFVTQEGTINAWRTKTDPGMLEAVVIKDYSGIDYAAEGLIARPGFNGVAMTTDHWSTDAGGNAVADNRLYVADFANGRVMSFDNQWNEISAPGMFERPADLSITYHPFNVQVLGDDRIYVAWAENSFEIDEPTEEIPGAGFGRIVAYDRDGNMLQDFAGHELLNAPGAWSSLPKDSVPSAATCWWRISATAPSSPSIWKPATRRATCGMPMARSSASTASGASPSAMAGPSATPTACTSPPGPTKNVTASWAGSRLPRRFRNPNPGR